MAVQPLSPATDRRLGGPLPRQLANRTRIISAEARGEEYVGQVAVGAVIMNRIEHPSFPNTLAGVIYQPEPFHVSMTAV